VDLPVPVAPTIPINLLAMFIIQFD